MPPDDPAPAPQSPAPAGDEIGAAAVRLSAMIAGSNPGALAELRRMAPGKSAPPAAFWRLLHACRLREAGGRDTGWEHVAHALALLTPPGEPGRTRSPHESGASLGRTLFEAGVSEQRLARLLATRGDGRRDALIRLCRRLAREGATVDASALARLLIHDNPVRTLRRVADDFYAAALRAEGEAAEGESADA